MTGTSTGTNKPTPLDGTAPRNSFSRLQKREKLRPYAVSRILRHLRTESDRAAPNSAGDEADAARHFLEARNVLRNSRFLSGEGLGLLTVAHGANRSGPLNSAIGGAALAVMMPPGHAPADASASYSPRQISRARSRSFFTVASKSKT